MDSSLFQKYHHGTKIGELLPKKLRKSDFTINRPQTLFGPDWSQLKVGRCPHCCNKLYMVGTNPSLLRCKSKKHKKGFFIHTSKIAEIVGKV